jgi:hypothetical protein
MPAVSLACFECLVHTLVARLDRRPQLFAGRPASAVVAPHGLVIVG